MKIRIAVLIIIFSIFQQLIIAETFFNSLCNKNLKTKSSSFCISYNVASIGYLGFTGHTNQQLTNGLSGSSGLDVSYNEVHAIFKMTGTLFTQTKSDLNIPNIKKGEDIEHIFPILALGYDIKFDPYNFIIPYIGYSWKSSRIWDELIKDYSHNFKYTGIVIGINWKTYIEFLNQKNTKLKHNWEMFSLTDFDFFITTVNDDLLYNGVMYNISFGFSLDFRH
jgi:hypothetical protein